MSDEPQPSLAPLVRLSGLDTMRFTTELLPLLKDHPDVTVEITGDPADYREAGDSLSISMSTDEVTDDPDWFDLGITITVAGREVPFADVFVALSHGARPICCSPTARTSRCRSRNSGPWPG